MRQIELYFLDDVGNVIAGLTRRYHPADADIRQTIYVPSLPWIPTLADGWTFERVYRFYADLAPTIVIAIVGEDYSTVRRYTITNQYAPF